MTTTLSDPWNLSASELFELTKNIPEAAKPKCLKYDDLICQTVDFGKHWQTHDGMPVSDDIATSLFESSILNWLIQYCGLIELSFEFWSNDEMPGTVTRLRKMLDNTVIASGDGHGRAIITMTKLALEWKKQIEHLRP
jgi:hypothetical protein